MLEKQEQVFWNVFINEYITWQSLVVGFKGVLVNVIEWVVWFFFYLLEMSVLLVFLLNSDKP